MVKKKKMRVLMVVKEKLDSQVPRGDYILELAVVLSSQVRRGRRRRHIVCLAVPAAK